MVKRNRYTPNCSPPHDCFNCPYDDCRRDGSVTRSETEYVRSSGIANGRHSKNFPLAKDLVHKVRSGWMV